LFPNPVKNSLSINIPKNGRMSVYDSSGKEIFSSTVNNGVTVLNTGNYCSGIYFLKYITENGSACLKFLKA